MSVADKPALIELVRAAEARRDWGAVADGWRNCIASFPDDAASPQWRSRLAEALFRLDRLEEARKEFASLAERAPSWEAGFVGLARVAAKVGDWPWAHERWDACCRKFPLSPKAPRWRASRAGVLLNLGRFAEASNEFQALANDRSVADLVLPGLARAAEKIGDWSLALDRWRDCIEKLPDATGATGWKRSLAYAYERGGLPREALAVWRAIGEATGDTMAVIGGARCIFLAEGPTDEAERWARDAVAVDPDPSRSRRRLAHILAARDNEHDALALLLECVELDPQNLEHYVAAADASRRIVDFAAAERLLGAPAAKSTSQLASNANFLARVVLQIMSLKGDIEDGLRLAAILDEEQLDSRGVIAVGGFLYENQRFEQALALTERNSAKLDGNPEVVGLRLKAIYRVNGKAAFEHAKAAALADLPKEDTIRILSRLEQGWLTAPETRDLIDFYFDRNPIHAAHSPGFFNLVRRGETEILERLRARLRTSSHASADLLAASFQATIEDRRRITGACLGGVKWSDFEEARTRLAGQVAELAERGAMEPMLQEAVDSLHSAASKAGLNYIYSAESYHDAASFAGWLSDRIRRRIPTSVIRISDGEGRFLPYGSDQAQRQRADMEAAQRIWWKSPRMTDAQSSEFVRRFEQAVADADAIGAPPPRRLAVAIYARSVASDKRGIISAVRHVGLMPAETLRSKVLTSCHIHTDLDHWDLYKLILAPGASVSVVSCLDVRNVLRAKFGVEVRHQFRIPPAHASAGLFGQKFDEQEAFYPTVFNKIMEEVAPEPGELFLVAAGFLGKFICDRIRQRGGIGFDVGSVVDQWMGHTTRGTSAPSGLTFDLASSRIEGAPF